MITSLQPVSTLSGAQVQIANMRVLDTQCTLTPSAEHMQADKRTHIQPQGSYLGIAALAQYFIGDSRAL